MAERVEDAARGGGGGEEFGDAGAGEEVLELAGDAVAVMGQGVGEPGVALGEARAAGARGAGLLRAMGAGAGAGGEVGHEAGEALAGAVEAGAERGDMGDEAGVAQEGVGDVGDQCAEDDGEQAGDLGGEGVGSRTDWGRGCGVRHGRIFILGGLGGSRGIWECG